jgi:hypothetical protein
MKHKIVGPMVLCVLGTVGLFGIYLRAAESSPPRRVPNVARPGIPVMPAPYQGGQTLMPVILPTTQVGQIGQVGGIGTVNRGAATNQVGQFGQIGGIGGIGGIGKFGGGGQQLDLAGKKVTGIEDGPAKVLADTKAVSTPVEKTYFVNPKVEPGKVKWHADFDTACKAAAKSGKPVMLFQMMGKLDDQFC